MIRFGVFESNATRFTDKEAWWFINGEWRQINAAEPWVGARLLDEATFKSIFPNLQALPSTAFQDSSKPVVIEP